MPSIHHKTLTDQRLREYAKEFNSQDFSHGGQAISNGESADWLAKNIPLFDCPDKELEEIYYFRWWTYRKHIQSTSDGYVITEFLPKVPWSGKHNTISCPAGHHFYEGRWLRDKTYLDDYAKFWFLKGGNPRLYSFWVANAYLAYAKVTGDRSLCVELLPHLVKNYEAWEADRFSDNGLFWQDDDRDGGEESIAGKLSPDHTGYRPTINSYMYGDAKAIEVIAGWANHEHLAEEYNLKGQKLRENVLKDLWDPEDEFFKVLPRVPNPHLAKVRELHGYVPWYFSLPPEGIGYEKAWAQLLNPKGFLAPFGPTSAEQRHPEFKISYEGHECQWNGPSWPYATSMTLTGLANLLNGTDQKVMDKKSYFDLLKTYARSHRLLREDGVVVPWIDENLNPYTGDWIARTRLKNWENGNWSERKGGEERGKDYNHSTFCDLVITGLVGLRPREDEVLELNPLIPESRWEYFCLDGVSYHGRNLTIIWDRDGKKYGKSKGLSVLVNGEPFMMNGALGRTEKALPN